ncbi:tRNA pseudouridine(38/39) synthase isoform X2 [Melanerpes formicivorus]|uniref:tRNA pseudouridine(38/39) synthase isoform X2 n=1 Tax=Melanerpes formicivorus TaxID=211600 RepID=UPI00358E9C3C
MAEGNTAPDPEQLLRRVQELEEEVKRLREKLQEDSSRGEAPAGPGRGRKQQQRPFDFGAHGRRRVALKIAYLGWGYQGFASQENTSNTVEEKLFEALTKTRLVDSRQSSNYHRCGRTDKGVSAFGQVRCMMAILFLVGQGAESPEVIDELLDVEKNPRKPQYSMAVEFPLVLYNCEFENLQWLYDRDVQEFNVTHLQQLWASQAVKTQVLRDMLQGLEAAPVPADNSPGSSTTIPWGELKPALHSQTSSFMEGVRARTYKPLLARPKCEGLEARIRHFVRRGRIESPPGLPPAGEEEQQPPEAKRSQQGAALESGGGGTEQPAKRLCVEVPSDPAQRRVRQLARLSRRLQQLHPNVLAKILKEGTLFQNEEVVVINKPYGLPVHGGPGVRNCIADVLPILAKMLGNMRAEPLHLCHRLDKETTGVMVLARSKEVADRVRLLFKTRQVEKTYWAITLGEPDPAEGIVEIPIVEKAVQSHQSHYKMTLAPNYRLCEAGGQPVRTRRQRGAESAVTRYRRLASATACSLLELQPVTGVKHQIRVHLAYGLGCPILGDHKYSHWSKLAPQKLPEVTLRRLKLRQSKARHLPLHLHARRLCLPLGQRLELVCKPPPFFLRTLEKLHLDISKD